MPKEEEGDGDTVSGSNMGGREDFRPSQPASDGRFFTPSHRRLLAGEVMAMLGRWCLFRIDR